MGGSNYFCANKWARVKLFFVWVQVLTLRSSGRPPAAAYLNSLGTKPGRLLTGEASNTGEGTRCTGYRKCCSRSSIRARVGGTASGSPSPLRALGSACGVLCCQQSNNRRSMRATLCAAGLCCLPS